MDINEIGLIDEALRNAVDASNEMDDYDLRSDEPASCEHWNTLVENYVNSLTELKHVLLSSNLRKINWLKVF